MLIPPTDRTDVSLLDLLNRLMLIGGGDVDPGRYGAEPHPTVDGVDPTRDAVELAVATGAMAISLPTLVICRGAQLLNVALGGTLIQHLPDQATGVIHRGAGGATEASFYVTERIRVAPESQLTAICGAGSLEVAASHHQAIATLSRSLAPVAWAVDGVIEAVEIPGDRTLSPGSGIRSAPPIVIRRNTVCSDGWSSARRRPATPDDQSSRIGRRRMRCPVAANTALVTAGATGGIAGSPVPVGGSVLGTIWTSTVGISLMRNIG